MALQAGIGDGSHERASELWREVVGLTLKDSVLGEAIARNSAVEDDEQGASQGHVRITDREMEVSCIHGRVACSSVHALSQSASPKYLLFVVSWMI